MKRGRKRKRKGKGKDKKEKKNRKVAEFVNGIKKSIVRDRKV